MEILLIRHGSASWDTKTDIERELTAVGEQEVNAAAGWIAASSWRPDELWVSPYKRAVQTAAIFVTILITIITGDECSFGM